MMESAWHSLSLSDIGTLLASDTQGLSTAEAAARLEIHGANSVQTAPPPSAAKRFLRQFNNILIYILLTSALLTALMQHWTDMAVILCVVLVNAMIGFIQESKAEKALQAIRDLLSPQATVLREGETQRINADYLVPGDIVFLTAGDKVPADLRLISAHALRMQEAVLSGESLDVEKNTHAVAAETPLAARTCMAFSGTLVTSGQGKGMVVSTGQQTQIGRIGLLLGTVESPQTTLTLKLARLSRRLATIILMVSFGLFLYGIYVRELPLQEMFMVMIGIAVSAIPEGLPAVISITMALGVRAMARRNAIVRHLPAIEALGSVTVICTDKTGTLTRNELAVTDIVTAETGFSVTGSGYSPEGSIILGHTIISLPDHPTLGSIGHAAILNNDATLTQAGRTWELHGDPTEGALLAFATKAGHTAQTRQAWPRYDVIPFSAETRYMATLHHGAEGNLIYVKGAPEQILARCDSQRHANGGDAPLAVNYWQAHVHELAKQGKRVLALACRRTLATHRRLTHEDIENNLTLLGLLGIMDTPREEAREAIAICLNAGIAVKMITGDHPVTASSIGEALGIPDSAKVMTGLDIDRLSDDALAERAHDINIYARMHPEHKLRLVQALQAHGAVVAMTGDGVNDAPALKRADIGIAMGKGGTEAAKEASDLVLADDHFATIAHAVEEGRTIYRNIQRTIQFMLVTDGAEGLTLLAALLAGFTLPITPLQILWVNMITAVTLSLAFAFAPRSPSVMQNPPVPAGSPLFGRRHVVAMAGHILLIAGGTIALFLIEMQHSDNVAQARTMAVNTLVFFQIYYLWGMFPLHASLSKLMPVILATIGVLFCQMIFTYAPSMQDIFATAALDAVSWLKIAALSAGILACLLGERLIRKP